MTRLKTAAVAAIAALSATAASAQSDPMQAAVNARQAHMQLFAHNLGILGGMARGNMDYDATIATAAATDLVALASVSQQAYWPEGSDIEGSDALPAIWENPEDFATHRADLLDAATALAVVAGDGLEGLGGGLRGVGGTCGACHEDYRVSDD